MGKEQMLNRRCQRECGNSKARTGRNLEEPRDSGSRQTTSGEPMTYQQAGRVMSDREEKRGSHNGWK